MTIESEKELVGRLLDFLEACRVTEKEACYAVGTVMIVLLTRFLALESEDRKLVEVRRFCKILAGAVGVRGDGIVVQRD